MTNHPNRSNAIVIINDGQYRWGADRTELMAALERLGWGREGSLWTEPTSDDDADPAAAYTALCQIVQPVSGYAIDDSYGENVDLWNALAQFVARDDIGRGTWQYSAA